MSTTRASLSFALAAIASVVRNLYTPASALDLRTLITLLSCAQRVQRCQVILTAQMMAAPINVAAKLFSVRIFKNTWKDT